MEKMNIKVKYLLNCGVFIFRKKQNQNKTNYRNEQNNPINNVQRISQSVLQQFKHLYGENSLPQHLIKHQGNRHLL